MEATNRIFANRIGSASTRTNQWWFGYIKRTVKHYLHYITSDGKHLVTSDGLYYKCKE